MDLEEKINKGSVVDVRAPKEYQGGKVANSVNIPLNEIPERIDEFKNMKKPVVLCCASGNRSGQAERILSKQGINCINGGSWLNVNNYSSLKKN